MISWVVLYSYQFRTMMTVMLLFVHAVVSMTDEGSIGPYFSLLLSKHGDTFLANASALST